MLAEEDDTQGVDPVITYTLPSDGLYTIRLDTWGEGPYSVMVSTGVQPGGNSGGGVVASGSAVRQWASMAIGSSEYTPDDWSAQQAIGAPDTLECGDIATAWATGSSTGQDNLYLSYATAVVPTGINVYETYNPGAIVMIDVVDTDGNAVTVYTAQEQIVDQCPRTLNVQVSGISKPVDGVVVYLDQTNHNGWNEIDAVELVGTAP